MIANFSHDLFCFLNYQIKIQRNSEAQFWINSPKKSKCEQMPYIAFLGKTKTM